ncbi:hypothetical protein PR202_ga07818 [Eleusine coracana subsp. coracana]|uniref:Uncharacterized protein n=1 Tax=Eleusine coracana subsp. coracana TaxID=191504 RepID=A0AAV5C1N4_ELECO|nr:hypothetical protein PR202_ga07818 [Eleusine coracana subsp. coracana]
MLLKSVGESDIAGNMDGNAHNMDSQIDLSNKQPKSSNSPTVSTVVPTEKDHSQSTSSGMIGGPEHSQSTQSRMTDDPSSTQSQLDHFVPVLMNEKGIVSEQLSSSHNASESCPAADNYFEVVHDDHSLDRLNMPSTELDSRKLNNETFPEFSPLEYVTDSYHFEHVNQESEVDLGTGIPDTSSFSGDEHEVLGNHQAVLPSVKDSGMSILNQESSFMVDAKSALEDDEEHNIISPDSKPEVENPSVSMNPNTDTVCTGTESIAKEDKEHAISMGELRTGETQDKSGNQDVQSEKCQTDGSIIQPERHKDVATPSTFTSSENAVEKIVGTSLNARNDLDAHVQVYMQNIRARMIVADTNDVFLATDTVLSRDADCSPGSVLSQGKKLGSSADEICADATCGPPSVISCTDPLSPKRWTSQQQFALSDTS